MADSNFVFERGNAIAVGNAIENDFVHNRGDLVSDGDVSQLTFIQDRGLGAGQTFTIELTDNDVNTGTDVASFNGGSDFTAGDYQIEITSTEKSYTVWNINKGDNDPIVCDDTQAYDDEFWRYSPCARLYIETDTQKIFWPDFFTDKTLDRHNSTATGTLTHDGGPIRITQFNDSTFSDNRINCIVELTPL